MRKRTYVIIVLAVVLFCAGGSWIYFWQSRPVGSGRAGPAVPREAFASPWTDREVLLVGLGGSVTAGFGARKGDGYFDRLVTNPPDKFPDMEGMSSSAVLPGLRVMNLAVSDRTSMEHAGKQLPRLPVEGSNVPGIVVITAGGNDLIHIPHFAGTGCIARSSGPSIMTRAARIAGIT